MTYATQAIIIDFRVDGRIVSKTLKPSPVFLYRDSYPWSRKLRPITAEAVEEKRVYNEGSVHWLLATPIRFVEGDNGEIIDISKLEADCIKLRRVPITLEAKS